MHSAIVIEGTQEIFDELKGREASCCVLEICPGFEYPTQHSLCVTGQLLVVFFPPALLIHSE